MHNGTPQSLDENRAIGTGRNADLGILFIHGVGRQRPGQTLARCSGPLYAALSGRITSADSAASIYLDRLRLVRYRGLLRSDDSAVRQAPEALDLTIASAKGDRCEDVLWILAESCWSDRRISPVFVSLLCQIKSGTRRALAAIGTGTAGLLLNWLLNKNKTNTARGLSRGFLDAMRHLHGSLVLSVGNLLACRNDIGKWGRTVDGVRADMDWLSARCDRVAVLAHSHGAAVMSDVLACEDINRKISLVVTYGAVSRSYLNKSRDYLAARQEMPSESRYYNGSQRFCWLDFVAIADPFACNPDAGSTPIRSIQIRGEKSFLSAHWAYWSNLEEFVLPVATALLRVGQNSRRLVRENQRR
jgi:hypothetical protein